MSHSIVDIGGVTNWSRVAGVFPFSSLKGPCPGESHNPRQMRQLVALGTRNKLGNRMKPPSPRICQSNKPENKNIPVTALLGTYPKELITGTLTNTCPPVCSDIIYKNQMIETIQSSAIGDWIVKLWSIHMTVST